MCGEVIDDSEINTVAAPRVRSRGNQRGHGEARTSKQDLWCADGSARDWRDRATHHPPTSCGFKERASWRQDPARAPNQAAPDGVLTFRSWVSIRACWLQNHRTKMNKKVAFFCLAKIRHSIEDQSFTHSFLGPDTLLVGLNTLNSQDSCTL